MTTQPNSSVSYDSSPRSTRDRVLGVAISLMVVMPGIALAQSRRPPIVELGAQVSTRIGDERHVAWSPRLTAPLKRVAAIEATADIQSFEFGGGYRKSATESGVHWRQAVFTSGRVRVFGVLGGGRHRVETNVPEIPIPLFRAGEHPSAPSAATAATAIPNAKPKAAQSTPPPSAWRRVKPGREVWVTTSTGSLVHGKVAAISDSSLNIREQDREVTIRLDDVRLVEGRDSKKNGLAIGGTSAALAGGLFFARLATELCEGGQECGGDTGGAFLLGAASGFVVGGLLGMMVDALIPGRQTLFGGSTTVVTPVIAPTGKAVNVAIRWQ